MLTKQDILKRVETELVMKSKTISHIILEGVDGVGKTSTLVELLRQCNYRYVVYDRGELSNFVYSKIYNRPFVSLQRNLPFIYVLLTCDKRVLANRIIDRMYDLSDIDKIDTQDMFIKYAKEFEKDFHIITVDNTHLTCKETAAKILELVDEYVNNLPIDDTETDWNKAYRKAYTSLGHKFEVRNNQPYVDGKMFMSESTWQNGAYETFTDKSCPDNLVFSLTYSKDCHCDTIDDKTIDFAYVINSKINRRHEIVDYYISMLSNNKSCLVSNKIYNAFDENDNLVSMPKVFGDEFIRHLSKAKATVYCARDLEYLKLQTCRLYEAIIANQIVFVDKDSDKDCDILKQIHKDVNIVDLLYVTPETIIENYDKIVNDNELYETILKSQKTWYKQLLNSVFGGKL